MKINRGHLVLRGIMPLALLLVLLVFLFSPVSGRGSAAPVTADHAAQPGPPQPAIERLLEHTNGEAIVSVNSATGAASFVRLPRRDGAAQLTLTPGLSARSESDAFLRAYGDVFGIQDVDSQLEFVAERSDFSGRSHLIYKQVHNGVDVFAGQLRVHLDRSNRVEAANGIVLPRIDVDTTPSISDAAAVDNAVAHIASQRGVSNASSDLAAANSHLYIYREGLLQRISGATRLVYEVEVVNSNRSVREFVYVDAHSGTIVDQISGIHNDLDRKVSEVSLGNVVWEDSAGDPDPIPPGWEGGTAQQVTDWQNEIDGAKETYYLFASMAGRDSYDGAGATMRTVNNDPGINCPNANWNGTSTNYCSNVTGDDTVAHEWGHAYTEYTNGLIYAWQSGALNESYSDIWGEAVDLLNGRGTDTPDLMRDGGFCSSNPAGANLPGNPTIDTVRWLSGEDDPAFGGAIRDLWEPTCFGDPGKVTDDEYHCAQTDGGGVHTNSGVPNHGFALMVDGGEYNGQSITGIGLTKAAHIHWAAQNMLTPASDFVDHADALEAACTGLIGVDLPALSTSTDDAGLSGEIITAADCQEVAKAIEAVEFRVEPTACGFEPLLEPEAPALCEAGEATPFFFEDWESGSLPAGWTVGSHDVANPATFDTPNWDVVDDLPNGANGMFAAFVPDLIIGNCAEDDESGAVFLDSPVITVPEGASVPRVAFDHWVATEMGWDGGNVKISVNGGPWSVLPPSAFTFNSYNTSLNPTGAGNTNPLAGEPAFSGTNAGSVNGSWGQSQVNLSGIAQVGDEVQFRFDFGVDGCNGIIGWFVDDIQAYSCSGEMAPAQIEVDPDSLAAEVDPGQTTDDTLTITNTGEADLEWNIVEEDQTALLLGATGTASITTLPLADPAAAAAQLSRETALSTQGLPTLENDPSAVPPGNFTITHSASQEIVAGNSVWCPAAPGNSYIRVFDLVNEFDITSSFDVTEVEVGIQTAVSIAGSQSVTVNLYTLDGPLLYANMTEIGSTTTTLPDQALSKVTIPVTGSVPPGSTLVVEFYAPANNQTAALLIGSNSAGETSPSYLVGPACGITEPTPIEAIGFTGIHIVMNVTGVVGDDFLPCTNPADVSWLSVSPASGTTTGGASSDVTVSYDSTGLPDGLYKANLCVESNAANEPLVQVPVTLAVGEVPENEPPVCSAAVADPAELSPRDSGFFPIDILGVTDANNDDVTITIDSIFQDEPVWGRGYGKLTPDGMGVGTSTAEVRAERGNSSSDNGRVYHISFTADDGNGGTCSGEVTVGVPRTTRSGPAIDDGAIYDSTQVPTGRPRGDNPLYGGPFGTGPR